MLPWHLLCLLWPLPSLGECSLWPARRQLPAFGHVSLASARPPADASPGCFNPHQGGCLCRAGLRAAGAPDLTHGTFCPVLDPPPCTPLPFLPGWSLWVPVPGATQLQGLSLVGDAASHPTLFLQSRALRRGQRSSAGGDGAGRTLQRGHPPREERGSPSGALTVTAGLLHAIGAGELEPAGKKLPSHSPRGSAASGRACAPCAGGDELPPRGCFLVWLASGCGGQQLCSPKGPCHPGLGRVSDSPSGRGEEPPAGMSPFQDLPSTPAPAAAFPGLGAIPGAAAIPLAKEKPRGARGPPSRGNWAKSVNYALVKYPPVSPSPFRADTHVSVPFGDGGLFR